MAGAYLGDLPELVRDSKLPATFHYDGQRHCVIHTRATSYRGKKSQEIWVDIQNLGSGGQGSVDLQASEQFGQRQYRAVKSIRISESQRKISSELIVRELEAIFKFSQARYSTLFVKAHGWFTSPTHIYIAMEHCRLGDLKEYLQDPDKCPNGRLPEDEARDVAAQVVDALSRMHEEKYTHRDIKPANILIQSHPPNDWWVKLGDFGLSKRTAEMADSTTVRGTRSFMPPELLGYHGDSRMASPYAVDIWCLGETIFRVISGQSTFPNEALVGNYYNGITKFPRQVLERLQVSEDAIAFLSSLIVPEPEKRITAKDALMHPWVEMEAGSPHLGSGSNSLQHGSFHNIEPFPSRLDQNQASDASASWTETITQGHSSLTSSKNTVEEATQRLPNSVQPQRETAANTWTNNPDFASASWPNTNSQGAPSFPSLHEMREEVTQIQNGYTWDEGEQGGNMWSQPEASANPLSYNYLPGPPRPGKVPLMDKYSHRDFDPPTHPSAPKPSFIDGTDDRPRPSNLSEASDEVDEPQASNSETEQYDIREFQVMSYRGNLILDCPVPQDVLDTIPHGERDEFTHWRYTALTCRPERMREQNYVLRPSLFSKPRAINIVVAMRLDHDETPSKFIMRWQFLLRSLELLDPTTMEQANTPAWKMIIVHIHLSEDLLPGLQRILEKMAVHLPLGIVVRRLDDELLNPKFNDSSTHINGKIIYGTIREYTTQIHPSALTLRGEQAAFQLGTPVQIILTKPGFDELDDGSIHTTLNVLPFPWIHSIGSGVKTALIVDLTEIADKDLWATEFLNKAWSNLDIFPDNVRVISLSKLLAELNMKPDVPRFRRRDAFGLAKRFFV